jgi:hypothetical protein
MRCPTCEYSAYRGYVAWRGVNGASGRRCSGLAPCPDCGGTAIVGCGEGWAAVGERSRAYRCYLLDARGMVFLAEMVDAQSDDDAICQGFGRLRATGRATAVEVWEGRRRVEVRRRAEAAAYALPSTADRNCAEPYW